MRAITTIAITTTITSMVTTTSMATAMATSMSTERLARLLQLASPLLPVGAYSYSQGLELAVESGTVTDAASAERWIGDVLEHAVARMEAPLVFRMVEDPASLEACNALLVASRETAELRAETLQMGFSLAKLLVELGEGEVPLAEPSFQAAFAYAAFRWRIAPADALAAYLWSWLENQVMAAVKAVPLGQTDGQRMLLRLADRIGALVEEAGSLAAEDRVNFAPGLALASARHETQYSRLFRS
jgi:urease accessory protein